jgi:hypothetical protein
LVDHAVYKDYKLDFDGVSLGLTDAQIAEGYSTNPNFRGQYIKATNRWNSVQTHFGTDIWIENRLKPDGTGTGFSIPTDRYMIRIEDRNWNNEGSFQMTDCNLNGSSSTFIFIKNTSTGFTNLKITKNGSFISYGENTTIPIGQTSPGGKDYYNHQIELNYHGPSIEYAYSPYSNNITGNGSIKKAKAWVNRFMPKKNLFYVKMEGESGTKNSGISKNAWCRFVNLNIENSFPVTTWRNNQRGRTPLNSQNVGPVQNGIPPYNTQTWVNDASIPNSININYNQTDYFKSQIGGADALFKLDGNSYLRVEKGYVYGEQTNNLIHKSLYSGVDFIDCDFDLLECIDIQGPEWSLSDNNAKKGAFKLETNFSLPFSGLSAKRNINLYNSKVNCVIFKPALPYPLPTQFYEALRDGLGWDSNFIYPYSPDSTINKVNFSSTTPMIPQNSADTIPSTTLASNTQALNTNVGYNSYKLIPGHKYYNLSGGLTVVKVPTGTTAITITVPVEFGSVTTGTGNHTWPTQP